MSGVHAAISPSSLSRIVACPGSLQLSNKYPPPEETPESLEGTVAHHVAIMASLGTPLAEGDTYLGVKIDEEMIRGAAIWVETVGSNGAFETPVNISVLHPDCWGTPDNWSYEPRSDKRALALLNVPDYKYGHGYVEEFENLQLAAYAYGLGETLGMQDDDEVVLTIVQPRCYLASPVRHWRTTYGRIKELIGSLKEVVALSMLPDPPFRVSPECVYCPARSHCGVFQRGVNILADAVSHELPDTAESDALGAELTFLRMTKKLLEARETALDARISAHIRGGHQVRGWELKAGRPPPLAWNEGVDVIGLADAIGVNLRKEVAAITPTQALDRRLVDKSFVDVVASRANAALKLSPVSTLTTRKLFSGA